MKDVLMRDLAMQVAKARLDKGLTPSELADLSGLSLETVVHMENGSGDVDVSELCAVARALGMTVDISFGRKVEESSAKQVDDEFHELFPGLVLRRDDGVMYKIVNVRGEKVDLITRPPGGEWSSVKTMHNPKFDKGRHEVYPE